MHYHDYFTQRHHKRLFEIKSTPQFTELLKTATSISVIIPVFNIAAELLEKCVKSVLDQFLPAHEIILVDDGSTLEGTLESLERLRKDSRLRILKTPSNLHISGASNFGAQAAQGEFLLFLDNDDELTENAIWEVAALIQKDQAIDLLYGDEDKIEADGRYSEPYFKPDWSPEHLTSVMYAMHPFVIRRKLFESLKGFREECSGAQDYDLFLRASLLARRVGHVREVIYHWRKIEGSASAQVDAKPYALERARKSVEDYFRAQNRDVKVEDGLLYGTFRQREQIRGNPLVSIMIPTDDRSREVQGRGNINMISHLVQSIREKTTYRNYEIIVVDNQNLSESSRASLLASGARIASFERKTEKFNFSHKINFVAQQAKGEYFVNLNDDMEIIRGDWLEALLELAQQKEIGIVGGRLLYPSEKVQHAGVFFSSTGEPGHVGYHMAATDPGHNAYGYLIRNYLAVTGACIMMKASLWNELGGFDAQFAIDFNDIDFCLRAYQKGLRTVYTPYALLYHFDQGTLSNRVQDPVERSNFFSKWDSLIRHDPYVNDPGCRLFDVSHPF